MTPDQIAALKTALAEELAKPQYAGKSASEINTLLHTNQVTPGATTTQPKPFTAADIYAVLDPASVGKLLAWDNLALVMADINAQNRAGLAVWAVALKGAGILTDADVTALNGVLAATHQVTAPDIIGHTPLEVALSGARLNSLNIQTTFPNVLADADVAAILA